MKRAAAALAVVAALAAIVLTIASPALGGPDDRGIWCAKGAAFTLPNPDGGVVTIQPFTAVNVLIPDGKALGAAGFVTRANFALGVGAFCPGDTNPAVAGKTFTAVLGADGNPLIVNNLGLSIPGDGGAIYVLVH